jgi:2-polyprenyl-6-hydroxyphenyl methylase/3-demethylubiquinone-9 3-methyltransferase
MINRNPIKRNNLEFYDVSAAEWWNKDAKIYGLYYFNPARFAFFDRYLQNWQGLNVLDVGCGGGFSCEFMAERGAIVAGVDQSTACIQAAKNHAEKMGFAIDYRQGYAENLPFETASFDCVVCVDVLEHIDDLTQTIQEIHRVLKPGGLFFFDTINRTLKSKIMMIWVMENILGEIDRGIHDWNKFITPEELTSLMQTTGFADIEIKGFNLFGETPQEHFDVYRNYKQTGIFKISISDNCSVSYIGKAMKTTL